MSRSGPTVARVIWASILAGVFAVSANDAASAASDCRTRPGAYAGPGTHWFYRIDHATQRRCWYVKQVGPTAEARARTTERPTERLAATNTDSQPGFMSWLTSKVSAATRPTSTEAELMLSAPAREAEAPPPRRTRAASRSERVRVASRSERTRAQSARPQQSPPTARAEASAAAPAIDAAASEALYQEFLQWRVKQLFAPEGGR